MVGGRLDPQSHYKRHPTHHRIRTTCANKLADPTRVALEHVRGSSPIPAYSSGKMVRSFSLPLIRETAIWGAMIRFMRDVIAALCLNRLVRFQGCRLCADVADNRQEPAPNVLPNRRMEMSSGTRGGEMPKYRPAR